MSPLDFVVFAALVAGALALAARGPQPSIARFFGAPGERFWPIVAGLTAADLTSITMIALPAQAFGLDLRAAPLVLGVLVGRALCALFLVPRLHGRGTTLYATMEAAFGAGARRAAGAVFLLSRLAAAGVRLAAAAAVLSALCGGGPAAWAVAAAALGAALALPRGLPGVLAASALQCGAVFAAGAAAIGVCIWLADGGVTSLWTMAQLGDRLALAAPASSWWTGFWSRPDAAAGSFAAGVLAAGAAFAGDHESAQRWLAAKDEESASRAALAGAAASAAATALFMMLGTALYGLYRLTPGYSQPARALDVASHFADTLMPAGLRGLFAGALMLAACDVPALSLAASAREDLGLGARSRSLASTRAAAFAAAGLCLMWALICARWDWLARPSLVFSTIGFGALLGAVAAASLTTASGESAMLGFAGALVIGVGLGIACESGRLTLAWTWLGPAAAFASFLLCGPFGFAHH